MKTFFRTLLTACIGIFFPVSTLLPDGFVAGTLVKIPGGYAAIETLKVGSIVCCADKNANVIERPVLATAKDHQPTKYAAIRAGAEKIITSAQQKFFVHDPKKDPDSWIAARDLAVADHYLISVTNALGSPVNLAKSLSAKDFGTMQPPPLYDLCVAEGHNYFVTQQDFVVHNFSPNFSQLIANAISHSSQPLTLLEFRWKEGAGNWEFYYKFLTVENILIVIGVGLLLYALCKAFNSHKDDDNNDGGNGD